MTANELKESLTNISNRITVESRFSFERMRDESIKVIATYLKKKNIAEEDKYMFLLKIGSILGEITNSQNWVNFFCSILEDELDKL